MKNPDIELAVDLYYSTIEIGTKEIRKLFACCEASAKKKKDEALKLMAKNEKRASLKAHVNTRIAYQAWGLEISDLEKRLNKLRALKLRKEEV